MATGLRSNGFTEYPNNPATTVGKKERSVRYKRTILTGAGTNTLHILAGPLTYAMKVAAIIGSTPAFTSANANDLGFYKLEADGSFTVIGVGNELWSNADLSSALSYRELLGTLNAALDTDDNIGTILGKSTEDQPVGGVYLGLLIKTASTAASAILDLEVRIEEATTV